MHLWLAVKLMQCVMWLMGWRHMVVHLSSDKQFVAGMTIGAEATVDRVDRMLDAAESGAEPGVLGEG